MRERPFIIGSKFPLACWSAILAARSTDSAERERALETLLAAYWKPVYKCVRVRRNRSHDDSKDLTQGFFLELLERDLLSCFDSGKGRLRTYLRMCVDSFVCNQLKAAHRLKRGGGILHVAMDFEAAESELSKAAIHPARSFSPKSPDDFFEREWVCDLFGRAVEVLQEECRTRRRMERFLLFEEHDLCDSGVKPTYRELALKHGLAETDVTNHLAWARREFRRLVLERLRELCVSEDEYRLEARALFGWEPK